ncbi:PREDICTED: probable membrane-associated kinase regulator 4 [Ipomoea nil]|uniref:probable membrane-associated kinase regulator 4 n=1 Tax=Ipomoea nil TaxID=35883 RepID=UPI000900BBE6|nr:PREDICTED: probable membrane-associated kinase regulator 4 [Ipomoea nil]
MLSKPQPEVLNCQNTVKEREREMEEESPYSCEHAEEDYIDMEVCSHSTIFSHSKSSQPDPREFEFQMFSTSVEKDTTTSPADELFYKGKLLPLHLPPRLEMVEKLLQNPSTYNIKAEVDAQFDAFEESFRTPSCTPTNHTPTTNTPFESCNVSPAESCQVSRELNPEEYFFGHVANDNPKRTWTRKLRLMKQSSLSSKLKASRAYLKSLFVKSSCSSQSSAAASRMINKGLAPQANEGCKTHAKVAKKEPLGQIQRGGCQTSSSLAKSFNKENPSGDEGGHHRRSFSAAFKRISTTTKISSSVTSSSGCSSASSSNNSNGFQELQFFKRSASAYSDIENSIQAAIAHCKRSQQQLHSTNTVTDLGICSMSASKVTCEEQERPALCQS